MIAMEGISKRFGHTVACDAIDLTIKQGQVHALLGENGAGKTTLMTILYGLRRPDSGRIWVDGEAVQFRSPADAMRRGIGMVHQHFALVPTLTVLENCAIGRAPAYHKVDERAVEKDLDRVANQYGLTVDSRALVGELPVALQQRVEIVRALTGGSRVLILDEPTAVLTTSEADELFAGLARYTSEGNSVILITHKLPEVTRFTDTVSVLRRGTLVETLPTTRTDARELAELMTGSAELPSTQRSTRAAGDPLLLVRDVEVTGDRGNLVVRGVSFEVRAGEILGIAGVEENGQSELVQALTGIRKPARGTVVVCSTSITGGSPKRHMSAGVGHIPEDRERWGTFGELSVSDNAIAESFSRRPISRFGFLVRAAVADYARRIIHNFRVVPSRIDIRIDHLSGGNRQKLVVGRVLSRHPRVLIVSQPTRGLDLNATKFIRQQLVAQRDRGSAVLLVSADLDEIVEISDRIAVMLNGRFVGVVSASGASRTELGRMMAGVA